MNSTINNNEMLNPIIDWFNNTYEKDGESSTINISDVLNEFIASKSFENLSINGNSIIGFRKININTQFNFLDWFRSNYENTEDGTSFINFKDIFTKFTLSDYYQKLNKKEKRENNLKRFTYKIENCALFRGSIKRRNSSYNGIRHRVSYIIGFKISI